MYRCRLLLEEYGPEIIYIKGVDNTVADAISRLDYNPALNRHADDKVELKDTNLDKKRNNFLTLLNHYKTKNSDEVNTDYKVHNHVFTNNISDYETYPLNVAKIVDAQQIDPNWNTLFIVNLLKETCV